MSGQWDNEIKQRSFYIISTAYWHYYPFINHTYHKHLANLPLGFHLFLNFLELLLLGFEGDHHVIIILCRVVFVRF